MRGAAASCVPVALDPHQFGRAAADVEQDGAAAVGIDQRRAAGTASAASVSRSIISSSSPVSAATRVAKLVAVLGRAAGLGGDQPQPRGALRSWILSPQI